MQQRSVYFHGEGGRGGPLGFLGLFGLGGFLTGLGLGAGFGFFGLPGCGGGFGFCIPAAGGGEFAEKVITGLNPVSEMISSMDINFFIDGNN